MHDACVSYYSFIHYFLLNLYQNIRDAHVYGFGFGYAEPRNGTGLYSVGFGSDSSTEILNRWTDSFLIVI